MRRSIGGATKGVGLLLLLAGVVLALASCSIDMPTELEQAGKKESANSEAMAAFSEGAFTNGVESSPGSPKSGIRASVTGTSYTLVLSWGEEGTGPGQFAQFSPYGVMVDDSTGEVYVADTYNNRIQKFTGTGTFIEYIGVGEIILPIDSAIDGQGNLFVSDYGNRRVVKYDRDGNFVKAWGGTFGAGPYQFWNPLGIDVDQDGYVYVADWLNGRVQKYTNDGLYVTDLGGINSARDVAVDDVSGLVFVSDNSSGLVYVFDKDGNFQYRFPVPGANGIAVDKSGDLYINGSKYTPSGTLLGTLVSIGFGNSAGWNDVDKDYNYWVANFAQKVGKFAPPSPPPSVVTFSDSEFNNSDWEMIVKATSAGSAAFTQASDGKGNPDPYQKITHTLGGTPPSNVLSIHINKKSIYNPSTQGAIESVDYSEDARVLQTEFNTYGGSTGPALRQGGRLYVANFQPVREDYWNPPPSNWKTISRQNLTQSDFFLVTSQGTLDYGQHPDFSASGSAIEFGFGRANTHTFSFFVSRVTAIDNWSVAIERSQTGEPPDTIPPETTITSTVDGDGGVIEEGGGTLSDSITLTFEGTDNVGVTGFECSLDGSAFSSCTSPKSYLGLAVGGHTFQVRATDSAGNTDPTPVSFSWTVLTPKEATRNLMGEVGDLVAQGVLNGGQGNSLTSKLDAAVRQIDRGNASAAINQLGAFINQVNALIRSGRLSPGEGQGLIGAADKIIGNLS